MSSDSAAPGAGGRRSSGLLLDLYQLTMAQSYFAEGMHLRPATFALYTRRLPAGWGYLVAAGLEDALAYLERFAFSRRRPRLPGAHPAVHGRLPRLPGGASLLGGREGAAGGHGLLPERARARGDGARARGPARRDRAAAGDPLPVARGRQGRALRRRRRRSHAARLRPAPHAPCRCGHAARPVELPGGLRLDQQRPRGARVRDPDRRHHGALLHRGVRRRADRLSRLRALVSRQRRAARRHVRHGRGRSACRRRRPRAGRERPPTRRRPPRLGRSRPPSPAASARCSTRPAARA